MTDIFENTIICKECNTAMKPLSIQRNGIILRAVACPKCEEKIIHPHDEQRYKEFMTLKKKQFNVKMRFVGNSYAVSIPKEIVNFIKEHERIMNDMVKLCFEEFGTVKLDFGCNGINQNNSDSPSQENNVKKVKVE